MTWCLVKHKDNFTFYFICYVNYFFTGNPWNCECDALYSVYRTLQVRTARNITLWCEHPAGIKGESWDILEEECQPTTTTTTTPTTTGSSVTAVGTTEANGATADETQKTASHTNENVVVKSSPNVSSFTSVSIFITLGSSWLCVSLVYWWP
jgi:hypothetical protein